MPKLSSKNRYQGPIAALIVVVVSIIGVRLLTLSHAQSPYAAAYAADGQRTGAASLASGGSNASNQAVQFGSASSGTGGSGTTASSITQGVYVGEDNASEVSSFASATGTKVTMAETYLPWQANTGTACGWPYLTSDINNSPLSTWIGSGYQMVIGLPMVAQDCSGNNENTLAEGAAGDENSYFKTIAQTLVADGMSNAILRPGWEFDGTWYPWTVQSNTDATNFAAYWIQIVNTMRSVPGSNFKFLWSPAGFQTLSWNIEDAYPGSSYVDYMSFDVYDWSWDSSIFPPSGDPNNTSTVAQSNAVFNELETDPEGLNWLSSFAKTSDKPLAIPEWAATLRPDGHGLGDDPTFINNMANWMVDNHVAWDIYFSGGYDGTACYSFIATCSQWNNQGFPNSLAAFKKDFSSSAQ